MATATGPAVSERQLAERKFYSRMALAMVALVFAGFAPSFYLRGLVHVPRPNPTLPTSVMLHGLFFTVWMLVFVVQTQLVAAGRRDIHMRLGIFGMVLAVLIVPLMYLVAVWQVVRANQPPFTDPLNWTIVPLATIPAYALLVWQGWSRRRESQFHKRLMLSAALLLMLPAIGRLPLGPPLLPVFVGFELLALSLFVPLVLWDRKTIGHLHPATRLGISVAVLTTIVRLAFLFTGAWAPIAAHLPGV